MSTGDADGFRIPPEQLRKLKRQQRRNSAGSPQKSKPKAVFGTKQSMLIRSAPRCHDLFVFRVHRDISDDTLRDFLKNEGVTIHDLELVSWQDATTKSYRITLESPDLDSVLKPEFWPDGIGCRRFFKKKTTKDTDHGK